MGNRTAPDISSILWQNIRVQEYIRARRRRVRLRQTGFARQDKTNKIILRRVPERN